MSNTRAALIILGALATLVVSFGMTYTVYQYGDGSSVEQSPDTHIIEKGTEDSGS